MKDVEVYKWWLPPKPWGGPRARPYLSSWKMSREEAAKHGAIEPDLNTREVCVKSESPAILTIPTRGFSHLGVGHPSVVKKE